MSRVKKAQKSIRSCEVFNPIIYDAEPQRYIKILQGTEDPESITFCVGETRRRKMMVNLAMFLRVCMDAMMEKTFICQKNPNRGVAQGSLKRLMKSTHDFTLHSEHWSILIRFDVSTGPTSNDVIRRKQIDICGARLSANGDLAIKASPKVLVWYERVLHVYNGTHYPCIKSDCYFAFPKTLEYGGSISCPECKTAQCPKCKTSWEPHAQYTCEQYILRDANERLKDPFLITQLREGIIQTCPTCHTFVEKPDGCNRMTCTNCKDNWCWACGKSFGTSDIVYDHLSKNGCSVAAGIFSEDQKGRETVIDAIKARNRSIFGSKLDIVEKTAEQKLYQKSAELATRAATIMQTLADKAKTTRLERIKGYTAHMADILRSGQPHAIRVNKVIHASLVRSLIAVPRNLVKNAVSVVNANHQMDMLSEDLKISRNAKLAKVMRFLELDMHAVNQQYRETAFRKSDEARFVCANYDVDQICIWDTDAQNKYEIELQQSDAYAKSTGRMLSRFLDYQLTLHNNIAFKDQHNQLVEMVHYRYYWRLYAVVSATFNSYFDQIDLLKRRANTPTSTSISTSTSMPIDAEFKDLVELIDRETPTGSAGRVSNTYTASVYAARSARKNRNLDLCSIYSVYTNPNANVNNNAVIANVKATRHTSEEYARVIMLHKDQLTMMAEQYATRVSKKMDDSDSEADSDSDNPTYDNYEQVIVDGSNSLISYAVEKMGFDIAKIIHKNPLVGIVRAALMKMKVF